MRKTGIKKSYNEDRGREHEKEAEVDWGKKGGTQLKETEGEK